MSITPRDALRAWFLGPRGENADLFERLVTEALRDHVFWRRNYHPEDGAMIREVDKRTPGYEEAVGTLTQELIGLLAELKRDVPFFSGRYKGHMIFEQTLASQVGYFAAMLYNPNNVTQEVAPVTTRLEHEVAAHLAVMIGYDPSKAWGHLTSGGTVANFEALWIARNIKYLPVAAAFAARELGLTLETRTAAGQPARLQDLSLSQLLNLPNEAALNLWDALGRAVPRGEWRAVLDRHTLAAAGYQEYTRRLGKAFGDPLPDAVVLVAASAHYSWEKIVRALGIGGHQLVYLPLDCHCRLDPDALWETLEKLAGTRTPVLACVSVCGSTEEGAVDRLDQVLEVRGRAEQDLGLSFHLHSDACYGGYAAAVTWREDGTRRRGEEIRSATGLAWPTDEWVQAMAALGWTDSVAIDPHKLGYVPYPAGAFLLRDERARQLVAADPPYLAPGSASTGPLEPFIGRYILEGSKPGAAATAVWLSHKVLPLNEKGYGYLIEQTARGARRLYRAMAAADLAPFRMVLLPEPDLNIINFLLVHPDLSDLGAVNRFNERIYREMSLGRPDGPPNYIITRTRLQSPMYDGAIGPVLAAIGVGTVEEWQRGGAEGLVVLRTTVMDPFLADPGPGPDHVTGFVRELGRAAAVAAG
jgi:tyrosine decarboxylase